MVLSYPDFGRVAQRTPLLPKLLGDDFVRGRSVELRATTADGVGFSASGAESCVDGSLAGTLRLKYRLCGAVLATAALGAQTLRAEAEFDDLGVRGLRAAVDATLEKNRRDAFVKFEYLAKPVSLTAVVDVVGKAAMASVCAGGGGGGGGGGAAGGLSVGADVTYVNDLRAVTDFSAGATLARKDCELSLLAVDKLAAIRLLFSHTVTPTFAVAAEAVYHRRTAETSVLAGVRCEVPLGAALLWRSSPPATLKAKIDTCGTLSLALLSRVTPSATLALATAVNTRHFEEKRSVGIALTVDNP